MVRDIGGPDTPVFWLKNANKITVARTAFGGMLADDSAWRWLPGTC